MPNAKAKTINLLLYDGNLKGVISMADTSWNAGELYSAPRDRVDDLLGTDACSRYGVYLLLSEQMAYIGQASDLSKRIKQHKSGKTWWEQVVVLTTSDDSLNKSDIDYIESSLIQKAKKVGCLDSDNKNNGNKKKVDKFREVFLEQYIEEAMALLELIGITVFNSESEKKHKKTTLFKPQTVKKTGNVIIDNKAAAINFVVDQGISIERNVSYGKVQEKKQEYWLNPRINLLKTEWDIILNNSIERVITVLKIPSGELKLHTEDKNGFYVRNDKPDLIDMNIDVKTLVDRRSKIDFSDYVILKIEY